MRSARRPARASARRMPSATSSATCSATSSAAAVAAGASQVFRGADLRYELELDLEQAVFGTHDRDRFPEASPNARLPRHRRGRGHSPVTCDDLPGHRPGAHLAGLLRSCSRPVRAAGAAARSSRIPAPSALGQGRVRASKRPVGQGSCRRRQRRSHPARRAKARPDATAGRPATSMSRLPCASIRSSSAMARICPARCR